MTEPGQDLVVSRMNRSSLAAWVPEAMLIGFFALLVAAVMVFTGIVFLNVVFGSSRPTTGFHLWGLSGWVVVGMILAALSLTTWSLTKRRLARMQSVRLAGDRVVVRRLEKDRWDPVTRPQTMQLTDIGRVLYLAPGTIAFGFGLERGSVVVPVSRLVAEDTYERVLRHLQEHAPEHLYSMHAEGDTGYSRSWSMAELLAGVVDAIEIEVDPEGNYRIHDGAQRVYYIGAERRLKDADGTPWIGRYRDVLEFRTGFFLGRVTPEAPLGQRQRIECGSGEVVSLDRESWQLSGDVRGEVGATEVRFETPVPRILAWMLAMIVIDSSGA